MLGYRMAQKGYESPLEIPGVARFLGFYSLMWAFQSAPDYENDVKPNMLRNWKHWGIENSLHWCLDMTFREDYSRILKDHSAENMVVVRHMAPNILKDYPAKISLARKRGRCAYDDAFFADVMNSVHA